MLDHPTRKATRRPASGRLAPALTLTMLAALLAPATLPQAAYAAEAAEATADTPQFVSHGLVAVGRIPAKQRDKFGETFGSGSGMSVDRKSWRRTKTGYHGNFILLPDRGYNVEGTTDYKARLNKLSIELTPHNGDAPVAGSPEQGGVKARLADTLILNDSSGHYMTGLDPEGVRPSAGKYPPLPLAKNGHLSLDPEAVVRLPDGGYFISDEYGPYIYRFSAQGKMVSAIRPPDAFIPMRKGEQNFSSNNPGPGAAKPDPLNPETGRQNNQGFEGMSMTPDGSHLVVILQSATRQDGGDAAATRQNTRMLAYDLRGATPHLDAEYVVPLPIYDTGKAKLVAAQSELVALSGSKFLLLARDGNAGYGYKNATSVFRKIMVIDTDGATNIAGTEYDGVKPVAPKGVLNADAKPATLTPFIDLNDNAQLNRFGLHSGEPNDRYNLSEKWEALALLSVLDPKAPNDYFMFIANDNDFVTQDGYQVGAAYKDENGVDIDTTLLVYRITLPPGLKPY